MLFPYARQRLRAHLEGTYDSAETQADLDLLRKQVGGPAGLGPGGGKKRCCTVGA